MKSRVGTIYYCAPEVLTGDYTYKCDIWSIGVICYVLLCGFPPFNAGNERNTYSLVEEGIVKFPSPAWDHISPEAIKFIKRLTMKDPDARPTATEALNDTWIQQENVQPKGVDRRASFIPPSSPHTKRVSKEMQVQHTDRNLAGSFKNFMDRIKVSLTINEFLTIYRFVTAEMHFIVLNLHPNLMSFLCSHDSRGRKQQRLMYISDSYSARCRDQNKKIEFES